MEVIIPGKHKKAVHPIAIFKESWGICWKNLGKLSVIYLIFNLPLAVIYLTPMASKLHNQKPSLSMLLWIIPVLIISIWGHVALLLGSKKAMDLEVYTIGQSIVQVKNFILKYLGTILSVLLFFMGVVILGGVSIAIISALLLKVNKILAISICLALIIAILVFSIYFMLRWSLASIVCVLENARPFAALKRSLALVTDYVHPVVGIFCLTMLTYIVCVLPFIIIGAFLGVGNDTDQANKVGTIYSFVINIILVPLWTIITVVLYKKLKEALEANVCA